MSLKYLPEHANAALLALDLAHKEAAHLRYSQVTLFAQLFLQSLLAAQ